MDTSIILRILRLLTLRYVIRMIEYYVRMVATDDTYEYDVISQQADGTYSFSSYTFDQVREMFPDVRTNIDALIALQEHGAEIIDKAVDTVRRS